MITRLFNSRLPLMVYNPSKVFNLDFFSRAFRAGALPVFDSEFLSNTEILNRVKTLAMTDILFGVRLVSPDETLLEGLKALNAPNLNCVVIPLGKGETPVDLDGFSETKIILEVRDIDMTDAIEAVEPHGLILKGNEAGGRVSNYSAFILMQWYLQNSVLPIVIHGGVGRYTAAGMFAAGASAVVLDSQLWLSNESPLSDNFKKLLSSVDEGDSLEIIVDNHTRYRVFAKLGTKVAKDLKEEAIVLGEGKDAGRTIYQEISKKITSLGDTDATPVQSLFFLGQDAIFAKDFASVSTDLEEMISTFFTTIGESLKQVDSHDPIRPGTALAKEHGTALPLIQGPMANISDNADFAAQVLEAGALPFFAVGSLPAPLADAMLKGAHGKVKTFGAGLVGIEAFNPAVEKHLAMVKQYKVPFALFAGGIASQAQELEKAGTKTYLHTPSLSMLESAEKNGCTRFILEGKEAGGHIGSLSSLVLWEAAVSKLINSKEMDISSQSLVFAGGISTAFGSWFISGLSSILAAKGTKIGIQVGSAYLFSKEIVETGSIKAQYQEIISKENDTMVIGGSVGLASRTAPTEFARMMIKTEKEMIRNREPLVKRKRSFEKRNIGSLLIGAKGFLPDFKNPGVENFTYFEGEKHKELGNFLVGDSLAFFNAPISIDDIHSTLFNDKETLFRNLGALEIFSSDHNSINDEIAVIGMGCILPGASSPDQLWESILEKRYAIQEIPDTRMRHDLYFDPDKSAEDKSYTLMAGLVDDYKFDGERFGYTEEKAARLSRSQQMLLEATYQAVTDAGYLGEDNQLRVNDPERTAVIVATCLGNELGNDLQFKYHFPEVIAMLEKTESYTALTDPEKEKIIAQLRKGIEGDNPGYDPIHGMLLNIEASRVARHLGVRGPNYIVDAACASSFTAIEAAQGELLAGEVDQVIVGGVNTHLTPESFVGFCKMGALSAKGSYPFDERADGFVLGEGAASFVLKRMKDALRDGDTVLGVIKAIGSSSDGKGKSIAAPKIQGQALALERCFEKMKSDITPADIGFIEAHGTSTIMGDQAELSTLKMIYGDTKAGISSVKSQIGHLLGGAGAAGLAKAIMAVKNGILPPNGQFEKLSHNHDLSDSALYILEEQRPWLPENNATRKAGISAYGFGGINYHMVVEEYRKDYTPVERTIFTDTDYDFNDDRIVVAGLGVCMPGAKNTQEFWQHLETGEKQLSPIPEERFSNDAYAAFDKKSIYHLPMVKAGVIKDFKFNNAKYRTPPKTVRSLEPGQLYGLDAADEAIETSGLGKYLTEGNRTGVILGTIPGERQNKNILRVRKNLVREIIQQTQGLAEGKADAVAGELIDAIRARIPENNEDTTPGLLSNIISGRIANHFGLNGANYVVDASCASSVIALRNGARNLLFKDLDYVLAGGVDANLYPAVLMAFKRLGLLSDNECNFFDQRADGYVMGEGAAIHVLTTYKKAKEAGMTILAELNQIAIKSSAPDHLLAPSETTFVKTINECYQKNNTRKKDVDHLDLFAFSNVLGDMIEKQVAEKCFNHPVYCGNVKPQFGYFKAANPAVALAKLALMNQKRTVLPDFNYSAENSTMKDSTILKHCAGLTPVGKNRPMKIASNVNGIGGNHCHMLITTLPAALTGERKFNGTAVSTAAQENFQTPATETTVSYSADGDGKKQRMVALLSGQGAQRPGMMKDLYDKDSVIRAFMDQGEAIFVKERGYSLLEIMFGNDERLNLTENTQPAVFLSSAALFERLSAQGFSPDLFIGHSVGEYTALFCSGMLNFDPAMRLIIKRSELMKQASLKHPGKIMVVFRNEKETASFIRKSFLSDIYITNKNSENQTAVSGNAEAIKNFCSYLSENHVVYKKLNLSGAFHTPLFSEAAQELRDFLDTITFNETRFGRVISNVTATPYPENRRAVKDLLAKQITNPVEFIRSIESVYSAGKTHFIEIGPSRLLTNLLKNINIAEYQTAVTVDAKKGEVESFKECRNHLKSFNSIFTRKPALPETTNAPSTVAVLARDEKSTRISTDDDFAAFKMKNQDITDKLLHDEFLRQKRNTAIEAVERFDFTTEPIVISGVSVGLPGKAKRVFAADNFDQILAGTNFIEPLDLEDQKRITDKNITRLFKQPDGNARFVEITRTEDVIHLAGQLGYFDLTDEYGIKAQYDISMSLAVAAGIEALKDAGIPLVMQYKKASTGTRMIPDGFALPKEMQDDTGVIITSLFPNSETLINEMEKYLYDRLYLKPYEEFENIYYYLMEKIQDIAVKEEITDWFFKIKSRKRSDLGPYKFDRNFLSNHCPLGAAHLAQIIRAKGPNTLVSSACASTTQAMGIAEDWIRVGRCKRVIVVGGENATSSAQNQWVGTGFLALGAATVKKRVSEAAKPFDAERNGTILGSGAVGLIVERESTVKARGMNGQAEILGTHMANSAYHTFNIDVPHMSHEMKRFVDIVEKRHGLKVEDYADKLLFMSHETYTPARGGSADAEVTALRTTFKDHLSKVAISNTKGFTGHTLGAAVEDVVLVKALQKRKAPPIANLKNIPDHFKDLNFTNTGAIDAEYGLHLAAGFGSHFAFVFIKRIQENEFENNAAYLGWLQRISETDTPELKIIDNTLCVVDGETNPVPKVLEVTAPQVEAIAPPLAAPALPSQAGPGPLSIIKEIIAEQTGYTTDMLEDDLDLEADLGIDTVKQVEIFARTAGKFGFSVPEDLKLRDLNTIAKLAAYVGQKAGVTAIAKDAPGADDGAGDAAMDDAIKQIIAEQTGYTTDMLEDDLDLEADLGIDTVKQVEIFAKAATHFGLAVPEDLKLRDLNTIAKLGAYFSTTVTTSDTPTAPAAAPVVPAAPPAGSKTMDTVKEIIAEQTGYTTDMLEADLDLEADLGIDTVKQVEIFAKASTHFGLTVPEDLKLRDLNTIAKLADYLDTMAGPDDNDTPPKGGGDKKNSKEKGTYEPAGPVTTIQEIIAEQTGYTTDMLDADLDLEADLGIDTVKQVEIFAKVSAKFGLTVPEDLKLRDLNTAAKLAHYIAGRLDTGAPAPKNGKSAPVAPIAPVENPVNTPAAADPLSLVKRMVMGIKETPVAEPKANPFSNKTFVVTLDSHGFADTAIQAIKAQKGKVITLGAGKKADTTVNLGDTASVEACVKQLKTRHKKINGLLHFAHLDHYFSDTAMDATYVNTAVTSMFVLIKGLYDKLGQPGSLIASLGFDSIVFPYGKNCGRIHPGFAGLSGLLKTVTKEMAQTRVKIVDFTAESHGADVEKTIATFIDELSSDCDRCEVGYRDGKRYVLTMDQQVPETKAPMIEKNTTLLVTGGARGITFEILKQVVKTYKTDLVILGSSDIFGMDDAFLATDLDQAGIMALVKKEMPKGRPLEIRKRVDRIVNMRESAANIDALRSLGVHVTYHAADVTDPDAVNKAVASHDTIHGVIHAAGLEMSQFIPKKELNAFQRVVDVKVKGMLNLLSAMASREYGFFCTFSSVTARFGNEGQADYTAANDLIAKMALRQQQLFPERNFKVYDWTAWSGAGMATNPTVITVLKERGLEFLPLDQGIGFFMADLLDRTEVEVIISGLDYSFDRDGLLGEPNNPAFPFLDDMVSKDDARIEFRRTLDLKRDLFLLDHAMEDVPVFLGATGIETLAEAATALAGDQEMLTELSDFSIPYGIKILKGRPKELEVTGNRKADGLFDCTITSRFKNPKGVVMGDPTRHYQGTLKFQESPLGNKRVELPEFNPVKVDGTLGEIVYHPRRLFMDGLFNTITDVNSFDETTLVTTVKDASQKEFFTGVTEPNLQSPVVLVDAMFQTGGLFEFFTSSQTVLPYDIKTMKFYQKPEKDQEYYCLTTKTASDKETNTYQLQLVDKEGNLFVEVIDFKMVKLNKLAQEDRIDHRVTYGVPSPA
ncbi:MAG: SDR family NAD(P)-dependent oxidoreductase [Desulfobacterium sp.]|nr:SDR family NAD(P)-dependent oxidoreductase [Desulfobacterium sp.]